MAFKKWQQEYMNRLMELNDEDLFDEMIDAQIPDGWDGFSVKGLWKSNETARQAYNRYTRDARLGALVTPELAALLKRLALRVLEYGVGKEDAHQARELAARVREALEVDK